MCTKRPCRCSIDLVRVDDIDHAAAYVPGEFQYGRVKNGALEYRMF